MTLEHEGVIKFQYALREKMLPLDINSLRELDRWRNVLFDRNLNWSRSSAV